MGKNKILLLICLFISIVAVFISCASEPPKPPSAKELQIQFADKHYSEGLAHLENKEYDKASTSFVSFRNNEVLIGKYPDGRYLYAYAQGMTYTNDISMKRQCFKDIPDTYSGPFADEIKEAKAKVPQEEQVAKEEKTRKAQERASHLYIGDPESKIKQIYGEPNSVNKTVTQSRVHKQYVYPNGLYIYVDDGVVTAYQN